jgi:hypothetical protein
VGRERQERGKRARKEQKKEGETGERECWESSKMGGKERTREEQDPMPTVPTDLDTEITTLVGALRCCRVLLACSTMLCIKSPRNGSAGHC